MPIKNFWSLEPGECIVAEELTKRLKNHEVFFPLHDIGIDILLIKGKKHLGIQVKESRYYTKGKISRESSWHQIHKRKFIRDLESVDFYVFVTYIPQYGEHRFTSFEKKFLIVPTKELEKRVNLKNAGKKGVYSFYFHFDNNKVIDQREKTTETELMTYSEFIDAWHLIENAFLS